MKVYTDIPNRKIHSGGIKRGKFYEALDSPFGDTYKVIKLNEAVKITINLGSTGCAYLGLGNSWKIKQ